MTISLLRTLLLAALFIQIGSASNAQSSDRMYRIAKIKVDALQLENTRPPFMNK